MAAATAAGGDAALAAAHAALALAAKLRGDRPAADEHHEKALRAASAARDIVQVTRIRANRASALAAEGRYEAALAELRPAPVALAEATGYAAMLALALCNEGEAHLGLGRHAEATASYERALPILQRMGSRKVAYALVGLGGIWAGDARAVLALAERRYQGDFLEDEPYDDWALPTRDEARRVYLRVGRTLAALARRAGEIDETVHYLGRALMLEPYDEGIHGELIATLTATGRHGEAADAYRHYANAMSAIGVPPRALAKLSGADSQVTGRSVPYYPLDVGRPELRAGARPPIDSAE